MNVFYDQVTKSRQEADEVMVELEEQQREASRQQRDSELELERVGVISLTS